MPHQILERDWKVFRELHKVALERMCGRILDDALATIENPAKSSHEKYSELYKLVKGRNDDIARAFDDFRRSTAVTQISVIHSMGLFTADELRRFSPETLRIVEIYAPLPKS